MRTELKITFIQHLNRKQIETGFTLVELLVVIVIIGLLAAIALPNFLNQSSKAKQSEGKQNIALVNKTQNTYRAENNSFATSFNILAIGSVQDGTTAGTGTTTNYTYTITGTTDTATVAAVPRDPSLKGYGGGAVRYSNGSNQSLIGTVLCESQATNGTAAVTASAGSAPTCGANTNTLSL